LRAEIGERLAETILVGAEPNGIPSKFVDDGSSFDFRFLPDSTWRFVEDPLPRAEPPSRVGAFSCGDLWEAVLREECLDFDFIEESSHLLSGAKRVMLSMRPESD
jgi:hypothetical protein